MCESDIVDEKTNNKDCTPSEYEDSSSESSDSENEVCGSLKRTTTVQDLSVDNDQR